MFVTKCLSTFERIAIIGGIILLKYLSPSNFIQFSNASQCIIKSSDESLKEYTRNVITNLMTANFTHWLDTAVLVDVMADTALLLYRKLCHQSTWLMHAASMTVKYSPALHPRTRERFYFYYFNALLIHIPVYFTAYGETGGGFSLFYHLHYKLRLWSYL